jgi:hypothetical protein
VYSTIEPTAWCSRSILCICGIPLRIGWFMLQESTVLPILFLFSHAWLQEKTAQSLAQSQPQPFSPRLQSQAQSQGPEKASSQNKQARQQK